jgi:hypothetical protein
MGCSSYSLPLLKKVFFFCLSDKFYFTFVSLTILLLTSHALYVDSVFEVDIIIVIYQQNKFLSLNCMFIFLSLEPS